MYNTKENIWVQNEQLCDTSVKTNPPICWDSTQHQLVLIVTDGSSFEALDKFHFFYQTIQNICVVHSHNIMQPYSYKNLRFNVMLQLNNNRQIWLMESNILKLEDSGSLSRFFLKSLPSFRNFYRNRIPVSILRNSQY